MIKLRHFYEQTEKNVKEDLLLIPDISVLRLTSGTKENAERKKREWLVRVVSFNSARPQKDFRLVKAG